ncbi:hypothetical protein HPB52_024924 [Rhipicephalus sanguineus]|uniref:Uncharacterized protein n=1 Tax=Rhipicephalus sanguineus TaxID=34632 RepID=A0A9D4YRS7_RHISA|nr:hypothetical protein HPB52_024924 [Rhipicephalus sanguineus]
MVPWICCQNATRTLEREWALKSERERTLEHERPRDVYCPRERLLDLASSAPGPAPELSPFSLLVAGGSFLVGFGVLAATELAPWGALVGLVWVEYPTSTADGIARGLA